MPFQFFSPRNVALLPRYTCSRFCRKCSYDLKKFPSVFIAQRGCYWDVSNYALSFLQLTNGLTSFLVVRNVDMP